MKRYIYISIFLITFFLLSFGIVEYYEIPFLSDPSYIQEKGGIVAALGGLILLILDIFLPIPGSLIMIGNGALFGVGLGMILSMTGGIIATMIGFGIGKKCNRLIDKIISEKEKATAEKLMKKWGMFAIIITRPVPLLSETVAIIAGTTSFGWKKIVLGSILGYLPGCLIYSLVGSSTIGIENSSYSFLIVVGIAGVFWVFGKLLTRNK
ncbi:MAG: putative membrane protein YdjX (TVP38/TMEM64 family) [Arenicella sp.]|jgi:uncharacterized membrane protein YdjX (TVP38/TMEM64 family)